MSNPYFHLPHECNSFVFMQKPKFSHSNFLKIILRRIFYFNRVSRPYLSGDLFATLVDYAPWRSKRHLLSDAIKSLLLRDSKNFEPKINVHRLSSAKSLFVPSDKLNFLLQNYGERISARVIICGNSDFNFTERPSLPSSVKICLLQNSTISDGKKFFTLPIGLENLSLGRAGLTRFHQNLSNHSIYNRILIPPMSPTNKERFNVLAWGRDNPNIADTHFMLLPQEQYFELAQKYKFIFCSEGNGFDVHRIWETLYQGSFPVVLKTPWSQSLTYFGLPILHVNSYLEITPKLLVDFLQVNSDYDPSKCSWLWSAKWQSFIASATNSK